MAMQVSIVNLENYGLFIIASFFLWITPGQDTTYLLLEASLKVEWLELYRPLYWSIG